MKRGFIRMLGGALAVAALTVAMTTWGRATAQEKETQETAKEAQERERAPERARFSIVTTLGGGAYLGVRVADLDEEMAEEIGLSDVHGVRVEEVVEDGPAAEAGLRDGDVLVRWNGTRLESLAQLQRHLRETPSGRTVRLGVYRDGREEEIAVELGERSSSWTGVGPRVFAGPRAVRIAPDRLRRVEPVRLRAGNIFVVGGRGRMGVSISSLSDQLADYFGVEGGALITEVREETPAERAGLRAGDVIVEIAGEEIEDPGDVLGALRDREAGPVTVRVVRDGEERNFTVELEERHGAISCDGEECGEWAARWGEAWGDWAEGLSDRWEAWAEEHEDVWEEWGSRWEEWAEQLEDRWGEGPGLHIEGIHLPGMELGPMMIDLSHLGIPEIDIPEIVVPDIVLPEIDVPEIDVPPRHGVVRTGGYDI